MNKKWLIVLALIIVASGVAGFWYYMDQRGASLPPPNPPCCKTTTNPTSPSQSSIDYTNTQYGFTFSLPDSWQGYSIVTSTWKGGDNNLAVQGPIVSIRNPSWKSNDPTQDIPIMIFTLKQWDAVATGTLVVSAAPFPPGEIGRNNVYVFAIPPRYNYAFPRGYEEVSTILEGSPLHAFNL